MKEVKIGVFLNSDMTISGKRLYGPELKVVMDPKEVKGKICGLVVVTEKGWASMPQLNHQYLTDWLSCELADGYEPVIFEKIAYGFVTTEAEFLDRLTAGEFFLGEICNLYSYHVNQTFGKWPFES